jgi:hypothetical protein
MILEFYLFLMVRRMRKNLILLFCVFLLMIVVTGCDSDFSGFKNNIESKFKEGIHNYPLQEESISINEYFGLNISNYEEVFIDGQTECLEGNCPVYSFENKTYIKKCYFCDVPILKTDTLDLISEHMQSGSSDTSFGCNKKYSGEEKKGFEIIEKSNNSLKVRGKIITYFTQTSLVCDKMKDPECDDSVYGKCDGEDYKQKFIREVYLIFNENDSLEI